MFALTQPSTCRPETDAQQSISSTEEQICCPNCWHKICAPWGRMLTGWLFQPSGKSIEKPILSKLSTAKPSSGPEEPSPICKLRSWWIPMIRDPSPKLSEIWIPLPNSWRKGGTMKVHLPWHPLRLKLPSKLKPTVPLTSKCTNWSKPTTSSNNSCYCQTSQ